MHNTKNKDCPLNDPETFANPVSAGLQCNCPNDPVQFILDRLRELKDTFKEIEAIDLFPFNRDHVYDLVATIRGNRYSIRYVVSDYEMYRTKKYQNGDATPLANYIYWMWYRDLEKAIHEEEGA